MASAGSSTSACPFRGRARQWQRASWRRRSVWLGSPPGASCSGSCRPGRRSCGRRPDKADSPRPTTVCSRSPFRDSRRSADPRSASHQSTELLPEGCQPFESQLEAGLRGGQRHADVALARRAEAAARRRDDAGLLEQLARVSGARLAVRQPDPDVERRLGQCAPRSPASGDRARRGRAASGTPCGSRPSATLAPRGPRCPSPGWPRRRPSRGCPSPTASPATSSAFPTAKPTRQPVMLNVFESEWNSIATSLAPGTSRMLGGRSPS